MDIITPKYKILSITKVPPPVTGATLSNLRFLNSKRINECFHFMHLTVSYANHVSTLGQLSIKKLITFFSLAIKTTTQLVQFKPQLVYFQISPKGIAFFRDFFLVLILKLAGKKTVFHIRGLGINAVAKNNSIFKWMYKFTFKNNFVICFSELVKNDLNLVFKGSPFVVPNGLVPSITENQLNSKQKNHDSFVKILFISNYLEAKGVFDIIETAGLLPSRNFELIMIGAISDDLTYQKMLDKIAEFGLENFVKPIGPKYDEEKSQYLLNSDIFVFPTLNEGFGNVALEAMEASLPVVAYEEGSLPFIVDNNKTGFIIPKNDIKALAEKLEILIHNKELRTEMGKQGRKRFLELFTMDQFEENIIQTFNTILTHE